MSGTLITGSFSTWGAPIAVTNEANPYIGTGQTSGSERRTFKLASGSVIWDFGGNAWEWVSDTIYGTSFTPSLHDPGPFKFFSETYQIPPNSPQMLKFTGMATVPTSADFRLGALFGGSSGLVVRGGALAMNNPGMVGIFSVNLGDITSNQLRAPTTWGIPSDNIGFRCVATPGQY